MPISDKDHDGKLEDSADNEAPTGEPQTITRLETEEEQREREFQERLQADKDAGHNHEDDAVVDNRPEPDRSSAPNNDSWQTRPSVQEGLAGDVVGDVAGDVEADPATNSPSEEYKGQRESDLLPNHTPNNPGMGPGSQGVDNETKQAYQ